VIQRFLAIEGILEGLLKVVKAFTTSNPCHHDSYGGQDIESAPAAGTI
jgi:hypothetical protein